jgi:hypothetical protein
MTTADTGISRPAQSVTPALFRHAAALFAVTLFLSAFLLFAVQPMFARMVLPKLGGAPAVWSVAMVFFQAVLFLGYVYAHVLTRAVLPAKAVLVHLGLCAIAAALLPIGIASGFATPPQSGLYLWVLALFAASIGLPFAVLSASAPLLQSWFAASGHRQAHNPYVLYAASNLGSFAALIAYPFLVEPFWPLREQAQLWTFGFGLLAMLVGVAGIVAARGQGIQAATVGTAAAPTNAERARWVMLAAIPSGLVVAVTAHISTDVAAAPLLWIVPLALYLLTFVAVFRERPWLRHETAIFLVPFIIGPLSIGILGGDKIFWAATIVLNLAGFALLCLVCHGELYRRRPAPARLTEYYLWVSFGGAVGGVLTGLVAPNVFSNTYEYPILIAAALLMMPGVFAGGWRAFAGHVWLPLLAALLVAATAFAFDVRLPAAAELPFQIGLIAIAIVIMLSRQKPARVAALVVLAFVVTALWRPGLAQIETARSFFGVHKVLESDDGRHRMLMHGTTMHGAEKVREADGTPVTGAPVPLTYYYFGGPLSEAIAATRTAQTALNRVAVIGLGTGSLACHRHDGESWSYFEIDPEVIRIARDPKLFRFISACDPKAEIMPGDARLTLAAAPQAFDLIVLDAFSSDAIPAHLLTREAFAVYRNRLTDRGVIVAHVSNRHMELAQVVAAVGVADGLTMAVKQDDRAEASGLTLASNSLVVVLARRDADLAGLLQRPGWHRLEPKGNVRAWTDDFSDVLGAILRKKFGG